MIAQLVSELFSLDLVPEGVGFNCKLSWSFAGKALHHRVHHLSDGNVNTYGCTMSFSLVAIEDLMVSKRAGSCLLVPWPISIL